MKKIISKMVFVICFLALALCRSQQENTIKKISKTTLKEEVIGKNVQLIDVRTPQEYKNGHIGDALNFNINERETFLKQISILDKTKPVYLYCKKGGRSNRAAELLKHNGFKKIYDYSGGYDQWKTND
ncbi:MAG: rhodanese-like domain-containing protein [Flavobacteriaceae bacterium]